MDRAPMIATLYVGLQDADPDNYLLHRIRIFSYVRMTTVRIMDRKNAGADRWGRERYIYRFDVGNPLIELWIPDSFFEVSENG